MSAPADRAVNRAAPYLLLGVVLLLSMWGLVMVYSASSVADYANFGDSAYHLKRQLLWVALGLAALVGIRKVDYRSIGRASWAVWAVSVAGLVGVLLVGVSKWGARRWIDIGPVTVQPSEYAKLACVLVAAYLLAEWRARRLDDKEALFRVAVAVVPVVALVMAQPDLGTTGAIVVAVCGVLVLAGLRWRYLFGSALAVATFTVAAVLLEEYRFERLMAFIDPWKDPKGDGYQIIQGLLAFGSGGLSGVGLGLSRQKFFYLPAAHTDFVFAIIGEELGLIGTMAVVVAFGVLAYAGFRIAADSTDVFGRLLAGGLTGMIVTQAAINMAAVTGLVPITGIPLPLISSGGSSATFTLGCVGLILSVADHGRARSRVRAMRDDEEPWGAGTDEWRRDRRPRLSCIDGGAATARRRA